MFVGKGFCFRIRIVEYLCDCVYCIRVRLSLLSVGKLLAIELNTVMLSWLFRSAGNVI